MTDARRGRGLPPGFPMLCPRCHGKHVVVVNEAVVPCPECGGLGELHCCDGLREQVCEFEDEGPKPEGTNHRGTETQSRQEKIDS